MVSRSESPRPDVVGVNGANEVELEGLTASTHDAEKAVGAAAQPVKGEASEPSTQHIVFSVGLYAACSSTLLVFNKLAMYYIQDASFLLFCQFVSSSLFVRGLKLVQPEMDIEFLTWRKVKPFALACFVFYICLLSNTKALGSVNVETVIVVRACSPIAVSILEHFTLGTSLPDVKGILALLSIAGGAFIYVMVDAGFQIRGYMWLVVYFISIVGEMVFVKFVVETVQMSTWTRVYYNNTLSIPLAIASGFLTGDMNFLNVDWNYETYTFLALACAIGVVMSYAGFNLRKTVSATSFTVVGVVCKLLTVLINDLIWTQHSNLVGHVGLLICIAAGFLYERARAEQKAKAAAAAAS